MSSITIELPDALRLQMEEKQELPRFALEAVALEGYRQELLSRGQVGELLGLNYWETEAFLKERRAYLHYDIDDFDRDMQTAKRLEQKERGLAP